MLAVNVCSMPSNEFNFQLSPKTAYTGGSTKVMAIVNKNVYHINWNHIKLRDPGYVSNQARESSVTTHKRNKLTYFTLFKEALHF